MVSRATIVITANLAVLKTVRDVGVTLLRDELALGSAQLSTAVVIA